MPLPVFVAASTSATNVIAKPAGLANRDLEIVLIGITGATIAGAIPAGWAPLFTLATPVHTWYGVYWKRAGASEPATYTFPAPASGPFQSETLGIAAYRGAADPVAGATNIHDPSGDVPGPHAIVPSLVAPSAGLLLSIAAAGATAGFLSGSAPAFPGGYTTRLATLNATEAQYLAEKAVAAGATGTLTLDIPTAGGADSFGQNILLPTPAGGMSMLM